MNLPGINPEAEPERDFGMIALTEDEAIRIWRGLCPKCNIPIHPIYKTCDMCGGFYIMFMFPPPA